MIGQQIKSQASGFACCLQETDGLKRLVRITKDADSYYLVKRDIPNDYNRLAHIIFVCNVINSIMCKRTI